MKPIQNVILLIMVGWAITANAQTCYDDVVHTTPNDRFIDNGDGTVKDKKTNLIWMRCVLGQEWDGQTCTGAAATYTWQQALKEADVYTFAGNNDWYLPNIKELTSIVERACYDPAINKNVFPKTPSAGFWTASPYADSNVYAWFVDFDYGGVSNRYKNYYVYVRLVRPDSN